MNVLFCCNPLNHKEVDCCWKHEYQMAKQCQMNFIFLDYDAYKIDKKISSIKISRKIINNEPVIYRGWMMPVDLYRKLYADLLSLNFRLINSPEEYEHCLARRCTATAPSVHP